MRQRLAEQGANLAGSIATGLRLGQCSTRGGSQSPLRGLSMASKALLFGTAMRRRGAAHTVESMTSVAMVVVDGALHAAVQSALTASAIDVRSHRFDA
ncbi:hypothetical protein XbrCFBP1976_20475 [Xanthomonas bromi]|uniref:Uncharacterized protein n=1 Tax=Xanthomonas bromi TaxID=56449 RepID=A0ABX5BJT2_9XANT|nr:hypothetical protein XbrCFBP1976_20475 [Xanthomonas bromi]